VPVDDDIDDAEDGVSEESEDNENGSEEVKTSKVSRFFSWKNWIAHLFLAQARRRYLKNLLQSAKHENAAISSSPPHRCPRARASKKAIDSRLPLSIIPGYTVLVIDTNILLSSLSMISSLIENLLWTTIIPLPVIMELDGCHQPPPPSLAAAAATVAGTDRGGRGGRDNRGSKPTRLKLS